MTINEGLAYIKTLKARHKELADLRGENKSERFYTRTEREVIERPVYDVKAIDKRAQEVAKEIRLLDSAIKAANATTKLKDFTPNESVFDSIE